MAGEGQRFIDAGYTTPKPFIDVNGLPMVVCACKALPKADKNIFVCRKNHLERFPIEAVLKKHLPNVIIIEINEPTAGQAITCLAAKEHIPDDAILTIGASDNDMTYNDSEVHKMFDDPSVDGWIWTFRNNNAVLQNPNMYGWAETPLSNTLVKRVSCKVPLSNTPLNDHAIIGAFTFKKAKYFFDAVEKMVAENSRVNNEFYVDVAVDFAIQAGQRIHAFEVNQYICWGTPRDFETYAYWLAYFKTRLAL